MNCTSKVGVATVKSAVVTGDMLMIVPVACKTLFPSPGKYLPPAKQDDRDNYYTADS
jgi:hypothetical protein